MTADPPLVTILTPVYNGAKYLMECIESVLNQTYPHWEYVIVNNCSTDGTLAIAEQYAVRDPRIRVVTNTHFATALENHNIAFAHLSPAARYCKMVHADDWLYATCLEQMVALAEAHPNVGLVSAYGLRGTRVDWDGLPPGQSVWSGREIGRMSLLGGPYVFGSPTSVLFRADLVRARPKFYNEENVNAADGEACYDILRSSDLGFVHQVLTFTREHEESQSAQGEQVHTYLIGQLIILCKYGHFYLTPAEYEHRLRVMLGRYYRFLGRNVLRRRDATFWNFHRTGLSSLGLPIQTGRLVRATLVELYYAVRGGLGKALRRSPAGAAAGR